MADNFYVEVSGAPGMSSYELWLAQGNTGTLEDYTATSGVNLQPYVDLAQESATAGAASALGAATAAQFAVALARYVATRADGVTGYAVGKLFSSDETGILKVYKRTATTPFYVEIGAVGYSDEQVRDVIGTALVQGTGISITVNDAGDTITISATQTPQTVLGLVMGLRTAQF